MATIHVSPEGNDASDGSTERPVASIERAVALARATRERRVELHSGTHHVSRPVWLAPEDSGLTLRAAEGATPVIDGGVPVTSWTAKEMNGREAFVADVHDLLALLGRPFHSLFVDGERRPRSRWPRDGYLSLKPDGRDVKADRFKGTNTPVVSDPSAIPADWDLTGAELRVLHKWVDERMPIESFDRESGRLTCAYRSVQRITGHTTGWQAERAFFENVRAAVTEPGAWYLDREAGLLYVIPRPGERVETFEATAPACLQLVRMEGRFVAGEPGEAESLEPVTGVTLSGITFHHTDWVQPIGSGAYRFDPYLPADRRQPSASTGAFLETFQLEPDVDYASAMQAAYTTPGSVYLVGAHDCTIESCTFERLGYYAIELADGCVGNVISDNTIRDVGGGGINAQGGNDPGVHARHVRGNDIRGNEIRNAGRVFLASCGVLICFGVGNRVVSNHIHDLRYTGISCGWNWKRDHQICRENLIAHNHIHDIRGNDLLSDLGGIYTLGIQPGTVLRANIIHHVEANAYGASGIYTDAATANIVVEDNLIYEIAGTGITVNHGNCENVYRRNVVVAVREAAIGIMRRPAEWRKDFGDFGRAANVYANLLEAPGGAVYRLAVEPDVYSLRDLAQMFCSEANMMWVEGSDERKPTTAAVGLDGSPIVSWPDWIEAGHDRTTRIRRPAFHAGERHDYCLSASDEAATLLTASTSHPCFDSCDT